jgi:hypothetical protein
VSLGDSSAKDVGIENMDELLVVRGRRVSFIADLPTTSKHQSQQGL